MSTALHADPRGTQLTGAPLTERERIVLARLRHDGTLRQIGAELYVSRNTVKSHVRSLYRKLGVSSRAAAVERAAAQDVGVPTPRRAPAGTTVRRG